VFDDVNASVKDGVVNLTGKVTMPYKRDDIEKRVAKVDGVREVHDAITVLAGLHVRRTAAGRIARSNLQQRELLELCGDGESADSYHVEHSRVTLTGVVQSDVDRMLARIARHAVRRALGHQRFEDGRRGPRAA